MFFQTLEYFYTHNVVSWKWNQNLLIKCIYISLRPYIHYIVKIILVYHLSPQKVLEFRPIWILEFQIKGVFINL